MENLQITGKLINAAELSNLFSMIASSINLKNNVVGTIDHDKYGTVCSFVVDNNIIGLSLLNIEGGEL